eukprot:TRINITY_DN5693_c0_g1_i1.p1 TRINITY_DN5693_c0_g1~~TRINITY_DN5693_c0_g1_i1.p1  ORF type:complete len:341 (-),score=104.51 TRINITY_DN5693_c0_g1_i1:335-1357(-)
MAEQEKLLAAKGNGSGAKEVEQEVSHTAAGTRFERLCGMMAIGIFSTCYYYSVLYPLFVVIMLTAKGFTTTTLLLALPVLLSILLPSRQLPHLLATKFFKCALKYHEFEEIQETTDEELHELSKTKNFIMAAQPHGVMSVAGICYAINRAPGEIPPTAVASVLLRIPLMKQVFGSFNLIDASRKSLTKALKKQSVVIYVGGMAELFLSHPSEERLFIAKRTGFLKLAMQTGSDVIPWYFFGNTSTLVVARGSFLMALSRTLGVSITLLWGRWGLPLPMPRKIMCVMGRPMGLPQIDDPTPEQVKDWHDKYVAEVVRLFNKYKEKVPDYRHKHLILDVPST